MDATNDSKLVDGPVRRIGVQSRSITGTMPDGARYESALERDFMLLLRFDANVDVYTPQPVVICYQDADGTQRRYTPDGLVEWRRDLPVHDPRPLLVEIKYREAFAGAWRSWKARTKAAREYAERRGWVFEIYTEREIRTPFLDNARFLQPYMHRNSAPEMEQRLLDELTERVESEPRELIAAFGSGKWDQASVLPVLWKLLAERRIGCDFTRPLTMQTPIWSLRR
jgi:hypothetical protein